MSLCHASRLWPLLLLAVLTPAIAITVTAQEDYAERISFTIRSSNQTYDVTSNYSTFEQLGCNNQDPFAIIVPGWRASCQSEWVTAMMSNLSIYRDGCIYCMNYNNFAKNDNYFELVRQFLPISQVLAQKLKDLSSFGYDFNKGYMFGFSFGAHLAFESTRQFAVQKLAILDACDPAGPGFDNDEYRKKDPKLGAINVQCIHTSDYYGTRDRNCHQNWNLGHCGKSQDAANSLALASHNLCPYMYISAFKHEFLAGPNIEDCDTSHSVTNYPKELRMGYFMDRISNVTGDLFAATSTQYPYNDNRYVE